MLLRSLADLLERHRLVALQAVAKLDDPALSLERKHRISSFATAWEATTDDARAGGPDLGVTRERIRKMEIKTLGACRRSGWRGAAGVVEVTATAVVVRRSAS